MKRVSAPRCAPSCASADEVDFVLAFVKWHGLRLLERELTELRDRGIPLRVNTATYVGSSNLSRSAPLDDVEWSVRLSSVATPDDQLDDALASRG